MCREHIGATARSPQGEGRESPSNERAFGVLRRYERDAINGTITRLIFGEVSEWLKEHAWKVCVR